MAEHEEVTIASAVVVPPDTAYSPDRSNAKRRTSSSSVDVSKRPRLGGVGSTAGGDNTTTDGGDNRRPGRRRAVEEQERQRGQRLFGALLGTIGKFQQDSQSARAKAGANRRREVEEKLQQKLKQQTEELDEKKRAEFGKLLIQKRAEYKVFEERSLHLRHANILDRANYLSTDATPKLYYLPWKLSTADEELIQVQKEEAELLVQRELAEFKERRRLEQEEELPEEEHQYPRTDEPENDRGGYSDDISSANHHNEDIRDEQITSQPSPAAPAAPAQAAHNGDEDEDTKMELNDDNEATTPAAVDQSESAEDSVIPSNGASRTNLPDETVDENTTTTTTAAAAVSIEEER